MPVRKKTIRTPENIAAVRAALIKSPRRFTPKHVLFFNLSSGRLRQCLHSDLNFHPYKVQMA